MPFALRVGDIKFVTDDSPETTYSDFLELHNSCTDGPKQGGFAQT